MNAAPASPAAPVLNLPPAWKPGVTAERLALLFDDGGLLVAEVDGTIDGETVAAIRADLPKAGRLGRVRVAVLEVENAPAPAERLPASVVEILRQVRDTPHLLPALRAELDRVIAGAAP